MKRLLILCCAMLLSISAGADTTDVRSVIKQITVFPQGAEITREATVNLPKGEHHIRFLQLPDELDPSTLQVDPPKQTTLLSVRHAVVTAPGIEAAKVANEEKLREFDRQVQSLHRKITILNKEREMLRANQSVVANASTGQVATIREAVDFFRARLTELDELQAGYELKIDELTRKRNEWSRNSSLTKAERRMEYSQALVLFSSSAPTTGTVRIKYFIASAGWVPVYDIRMNDLNAPLVFTYAASIFQSTGEDWNNVQLTLSSVAPRKALAPPALQPWYIERGAQTVFNPQYGSGSIGGIVKDAQTGEALPFCMVTPRADNKTIMQTNTDIDGHYFLKPVPAGHYQIAVTMVGYDPRTSSVQVRNMEEIYRPFDLQSGIELKEVEIISYSEPLIDADTKSGMSVSKEEYQRQALRSVQSVAATTAGVYQSDEFGMRGGRSRTASRIEFVDEQITNLQYRIDRTCTILSDGRDQRVQITDRTVPATFLYHTTPKLDARAFLFATIQNAEELNLLPGKANIYLKGTYTGQLDLDTRLTGDSLLVGLGADEEISVVRKQGKLQTSKRVLSSAVKEQREWIIAVRNNKQQPVVIVVEDQLPITALSHISIEKTYHDGAVVEAGTGKVTWKVAVAGGATEQRIMGYTVVTH